MTLVQPQIIQQGNNYHVKHGDDNGLYVEFYHEAVLNEERSKDEGRPIYEEKEYISIHIIGDTKTVRKRPVKHDWSGNTPPDIQRWPHQYEAFKNQEKHVSEGTPITEWPVITKSDAMSFKAMNIHTVEQLAGLQENNLNWLGARAMRDKAAAWIAQAKDGSGITKLQAENDALKLQLEAMQNQLNGLIEAKPELKKSRKKDAE